MTDKATYNFYLTLKDDTRLEWDGLTARFAKQMYDLTLLGATQKEQ